MPVLNGPKNVFIKTTFGVLHTPESGVVEVVQRHVKELEKLGFELQSEESTTPEKPTEGEVSKSDTENVASTKELNETTTKRVLSAETGREDKKG